MSSVFTLDNLREESEKRFGSVKVQIDDDKTVTLRNLLRLSKPEKKQIMAKLDAMDELQGKAKAVVGEPESDETPDTESLDESDLDQLFEIMREILKIAADKHGALLISKIKDDDTVVSTLFESWIRDAGNAVSPVADEG